jgi:uncharacterized protein
MIRAVLDTNILVSALLKPGSVPEEVLLHAIVGQFKLCVSSAVYDEYVDVLYRPHLRLAKKPVDNALGAIRKLGHWVNPVEKVDACVDPDDNIFLECAQAAEADYLVTGNRCHFPERWKKTSVVGARDLIELLMEQGQ